MRQSEQQWVRGYDSGKRADWPTMSMQRLWDTVMCQLCIWLPTESGYHPRSPIPHWATVFWPVTSLRPPHPTTLLEFMLKSSCLPSCCQIQCPRSFQLSVEGQRWLFLGVPVRTCCWLPSFLQGSSPSHLFCTCLHLCPFLKCHIPSSPADPSQVGPRQPQGWLPRLLVGPNLPQCPGPNIQLPAWGSLFPASEPLLFSDACPPKSSLRWLFLVL